MTASSKYAEAAQRRGREAHLAFAASGQAGRSRIAREKAEKAIAEGAKTCTKCGVRKPLEEFHRNPQRLDGRHTRCGECRRAEKRIPYRDWTPHERELHRHRLIRCKYGIAIELLKTLHEMQEGCCAICGVAGAQPASADMTHAESLRALCVDHDHKTGEVRGLLCASCNKGLGHFADDAGRLILAAAYLTRREG